MTNRPALLLITLLLLLISSCKTQKKTAGEKPVSAHTRDTVNVQRTLAVTDSAIAASLKPLVQNLERNKYTVNGVFIFSTSVLPTTYQSVGYQPLWSSAKNRSEAIAELTDSWQNGLLPADYHLGEILEYNENFAKLTAQQRAYYDIVLTDAILLYAYHLLEGKLNPESLAPTWNMLKRELPLNTVELLLSALQNETLAKNLRALEPSQTAYIALKNAIIRYKTIVDNGGWKPLEIPETLHPGDSNKAVSDLRFRLTVEGYYDGLDTLSGNRYDATLVAAVKHFQSHHGLNADGIIGPGTVRMLNLTATYKLQTLVTNIERLRWVRLPEKEDYIKVNIASYRMQYFDGGTPIYSSKVMVGKEQKQTPVFSDELELIVFNPTWTLPFSISSTETLRKLKKDSTYLQKNNMVLIDSKGNIVSDRGIDWSTFEEGHFPYIVRQEPGPGNALGQVKFLFPNKYAIYLHDTPSKYLFTKEDRAFSHGCIRLQNPLDFALFILSRQDDSWDEARIREIIESGEMTEISLQQHIPIYLLYQTTGLNADDEIVFYRDVYNRDARVYQLLQTPETHDELENARIKQ